MGKNFRMSVQVSKETIVPTGDYYIFLRDSVNRLTVTGVNLLNLNDNMYLE